MMRNILDQLVFYQHYKHIFVDGIIPAITIQILMMTLAYRLDLSILYVSFCERVLLSFFRLWQQVSDAVNNLSICLKDNQTIAYLTKFFSQIDSFDDYTKQWNGMLIESEEY